MDRDRQREIARKGGKAAHEKGTAHEFTADEARAAGRKGGERVSSDRAHMSKIGRLGGKSSAGRRGQQTTSENPPSKTANTHHEGELEGDLRSEYSESQEKNAGQAPGTQEQS